jgi:hypothetical protein
VKLHRERVKLLLGRQPAVIYAASRTSSFRQLSRISEATLRSLSETQKPAHPKIFDPNVRMRGQRATSSDIEPVLDGTRTLGAYHRPVSFIGSNEQEDGLICELGPLWQRFVSAPSR